MLITRRRLMLLAATGLAAGGYGFGIEPLFRLRIQRHEVRPVNWPRGRSLRIAALADPHLNEPYMPLDRFAAIVDAANALSPDLTVLLGDYPAGHRLAARPVPMADFARIAAGLRARLGVHAILGNHDWWDDEAAQLVGHGPVRVRRLLEQRGVQVLENDAVRVRGDGHDFWLLGLGDQLALKQQDGKHAGVDDLAGTLDKLDDSTPAILLAHEPDIFPSVPDRVALTLCGHTHGGQVRLLGYSPVVPSIYGNRYAYGHVVEQGRHLVVSGGLGCSLLPVRFGVPPEITVVDLA